VEAEGRHGGVQEMGTGRAVEREM